MNEDRLKHRRHANLNCIYRDEEQGLRLDREEKRLPDQMHPRLLITFAEGKLPSRDETAVLRKAGFEFDRDILAWTKASSPANQVMAKQAINAILGNRGVEPKIAVARA